MDNKQLTVGQATEKLLLSLRALNLARDHYYDSAVITLGEETALETMKEANSRFDAVQHLIENEIVDQVRFWSEQKEMAFEI